MNVLAARIVAQATGQPTPRSPEAEQSRPRKTYKKWRDIRQGKMTPEQLAKIDAEVAAEVAKMKAEKPAKNPAAVALGKLGGAKGGKARAAALSAKRRKAIAKKAAAARWGSPAKRER